MQNHRRLLAVAGTAASLALVLSACGASGEPAPSADATGDSGSTEAKGAIAWSYPSQDVAQWAEQQRLMTPIIEAAGYEFLTHDPAFNLQAQVNDWQTWIARGDIKAMGGYPLDPGAFGAVTQEATDAGIPVISYMVEWPGVLAMTSQSAYDSAFDLGKLAGEWAKENSIPADAQVGIVSDLGNPYGQTQAEGYVDGLKAAGVDFKSTPLQTIDRNDGYTQAQSHLIANPNTVIWLGIGGDMALGVRAALIDSGISETDPGYFVGSTDITNEVLDRIAAGNDIFRTSVIAPIALLAESNAQLLLDAAAGKPVTTNVIEPIQITAKNAAPHRWGGCGAKHFSEERRDPWRVPALFAVGRGRRHRGRRDPAQPPLGAGRARIASE